MYERLLRLLSCCHITAGGRRRKPEHWLIHRPSFWCRALVQLWVSSNFLSGSVPPELSLPEGLRQLRLYDNALTGTLPASWELPQSLEVLDLVGGRFFSFVLLLNQMKQPSEAPESQRAALIVPHLWFATPTAFKYCYLQATNLLSGSLPVELELPDSLQVGQPNSTAKRSDRG
jgi:hypothetical protein